MILWKILIAFIFSSSLGFAFYNTRLENCEPEINAYCSHIQRGQGRAIDCLVSSLDRLSPECKNNLLVIKGSLNWRLSPGFSLLDIRSLFFQTLIMIAFFFVLSKFIPRENQQKFWRLDSLKDFSYLYFNALVIRPLVAILLFFFLVDFSTLIGLDFSRFLIANSNWNSTMPIWLLGICVFIFNDFLGYWVHRLFHTRWLWRFHSVHHSSTVLDWTSNFRNHPINDLLQSLLQIFILIVCGLPTYMLGWMLYAMAFYDAFLHENIQIGYGPLNKVFVSPSFHRAHHHRLPNGEYGYNFSPYFSFWDIIFKTANFSIKTNPIYGITNEVSKTKDSQAKIS